MSLIIWAKDLLLTGVVLLLIAFFAILIPRKPNWLEYTIMGFYIVGGTMMIVSMFLAVIYYG